MPERSRDVFAGLEEFAASSHADDGFTVNAKPINHFPSEHPFAGVAVASLTHG